MFGVDDASGHGRIMACAWPQCTKQCLHCLHGMGGMNPGFRCPESRYLDMPLGMRPAGVMRESMALIAIIRHPDTMIGAGVAMKARSTVWQNYQAELLEQGAACGLRLVVKDQCIQTASQHALQQSAQAAAHAAGGRNHARQGHLAKDDLAHEKPAHGVSPVGVHQGYRIQCVAQGLSHLQPILGQEACSTFLGSICA